MRLKLSRFAHVFEGELGIAILNSLKLKTVFVSPSCYVLLRGKYQDLPPLTTTSCARNISEIPEGLESALCKSCVLVSEGLNEAEILRQYGEHLTGRPSIHVCYLLLTEECNLRCHYCFIQSGLKPQHIRRSMDVAVAIRSVEFFHSAACRAAEVDVEKSHGNQWTLIFYGGEPTWNYLALEAAARRARELVFPGELKISLVTNGTLLDDKMVRLIKECDIGVSVSLDGPREVTDYSRNSGTYDRALAGFHLLRDSGLKPGISCTLPASSLDEFEGILNWLLATGVSGLGFNFMARPGAGYDSPEYYVRATTLLIQAFKKFRDTGIYEDRIMRKVRAFAEQRVYPFDCAACGGSQVVVAPDGEVGICHAYLGSRQTFVGSVHDDAFIPEKHKVWQEWSRRSPLNISSCSKCSCLGICGGGCPAAQPDDIWQVAEGFCAHARTVLSWLIWDLFEKTRGNSTDWNC